MGNVTTVLDLHSKIKHVWMHKGGELILYKCDCKFCVNVKNVRRGKTTDVPCSIACPENQLNQINA